MAEKTPHASCSLSDQAKLRKGETRWAQDDWIIVTLASLESMVLGQIELADIPAGRATWVSPVA
jgi:hypothetical protein